MRLMASLSAEIIYKRFKKIKIEFWLRRGWWWGMRGNGGGEERVVKWGGRMEGKREDEDAVRDCGGI